MNSSLPRFTLLCVVLGTAAWLATRYDDSVADASIASSGGDAPDTGAEAPSLPAVAAAGASAGDRLLTQVVRQLERRGSVAARLRHQVAIAGRQFFGAGSYWQQGGGDELRVRLELQIAGQEASLLQVSNSRFLWTDRRLPTGRSVTRVDLRQLRADPRQTAAPFGELSPPARRTSGQPELIARSGGLPSLLASLGENFAFMQPQAMRLAIAPSSDSQPMSVPVFAIVGHWKPERLASLFDEENPEQVIASQQEALAAKVVEGDSFPEYLPQEVLLLVGQADLFPYRIEYRARETAHSAEGNATRLPYQLSPRPLVVMELSEVAFDVPIAPGQFDYYPDDVHWTDQTASVLEQLRRLQQVATLPDSDSSTWPRR